MTVVVIAEKPSAARNMAQALGGASGTYQGQAYAITALRGHLYEFKDPSQMVPTALATQYKGWELEALPWDHTVFSWEREPREGARDAIAAVRKALTAPGVTEIAIATDVDPSGEGGLLAVEVLLELGLEKSNKKFTRMYFTDEAPASIQKAFQSRKPIADITKFDEFLMADTRSKYDMLTMQFTRISTKVANQGVVLRQGRLKSAMVLLVGDGLKAYNDYVKKPFFQNRFKDENNVVYTNPDEPQFANKAEVPNSYTQSKVVLDSRENKRTAPPKLLDLAGMSSILAGRGVKAALVLSTYQKMYEDQVVSYPRTEDRVITPEQFNEMLPKIDAIAKVVGADVSMLTHRTARSTHVKTGGAHGANRPGPNVPSSLAALESKYGKAAPLIYEILAKNYLAMHAEDYVYEQQKGHLETYPAFKGTANVPKSLGWKGVFSTDDDDVDPDDNTAGLGHLAQPFVHEGANTRPPHPTMKWLMAQLEKRDVGTGATRTSIYADVTNEKSKAPLLREARGKLTMAEAGEMSYRLLPGTHIGDLGMTERLMADMKDVAKGVKSADDVLAPVAQMVRDDIEAMKRNSATMFAELGLTERTAKPKASGLWKGKEVSFASEWSGHKFTQAEIDKLLAGETIELTDCVSARTGNTFGVKGKLSEQTYKGKKYVGFENLGFLDNGGGGGGGSIPAVFCKHKFTDAERKKLEAGETIHVKGLVSKAGKKFDANIKFAEKDGEDRKSLILSFN